jgi:GNAT superfamily N-acetyltransferase
MDIAIRAARADDHTAYTRWFEELGVVGETPVSAERFVRELQPSTLVAERGSALAGYCWFEILGEVALVRHLVTDPGVRRAGVGRALMEAVRDRCRAAGCTGWSLNVKPENEPAIRLYEALGLARRHTSRALRLDWSALPAGGETGVREMTSEDDSRAEAALGIPVAELAAARKKEGRVLLLAEAAGEVAAAAVFDRGFPGMYPFRATNEVAALSLLRGGRAWAAETDSHVDLMIEGQAAIAEALVRVGAKTKLVIEHMRGTLTQP